MNILRKLLSAAGLCSLLIISACFPNQKVGAENPPTAVRIEVVGSSNDWKFQYVKDMLDREYLFSPIDWDKCSSVLHAMLNEQYHPDIEKMIKNKQRGDCFDLHTSYLNASRYKDMTQRTQGSFGGIGLELTQTCERSETPSEETCSVLVHKVIEGGPSEHLDFQKDDRVLNVSENGTDHPALNLFDVVEHARGKPGTKVSLTVERNGKTLPPITVVRGTVAIPSADARVVDGICHVVISSFGEKTADEVNESIRKKCSPDTTQAVYDFRDNPGGLLDSAKELQYDLSSDLSWPLVTQKERNAEERSTVANPMVTVHRCSGIPRPGQICVTFFDGATGQFKPPGLHEKFDIAVLINGGSASASEIVAAWLQDQEQHRRFDSKFGKRRLFGEDTFGKVHVQTIHPLGDGTAFKYTSGTFIPGFRTEIEPNTPIHPDEVVHLDPNQPDRDLQLDAAIAWLKSLKPKS